jgi:hypothetical protein
MDPCQLGFRLAVRKKSPYFRFPCLPGAPELGKIRLFQQAAETTSVAFFSLKPTEYFNVERITLSSL